MLRRWPVAVMTFWRALAVAPAEGAWVMWKRWQINFANGTGTGNEEVVAAYSTYEECQQRMRGQVDDAAANYALPSSDIIARSTAEAHGNSVTVRTFHRDGNSNVMTSSWRCLPDTVDPRPKGR